MKHKPVGATGVLSRELSPVFAPVVRGPFLRISALLALVPLSVLAQQAPPAGPSSWGEELSGNTKVISVLYNCETGPSGGGEGGACAATVTKDEFNALVQALDPNMPATSRLAL